jgi:hypothetical protein
MPDGPALPFSDDAALNRGARLPSRPPDDHSQPPLADIIPGLAEARLRRPCHLQAASRRCSPPEAFPSRSVPPLFSPPRRQDRLRSTCRQASPPSTRSLRRAPCSAWPGGPTPPAPRHLVGRTRSHAPPKAGPSSRAPSPPPRATDNLGSACRWALEHHNATCGYLRVASPHYIFPFRMNGDQPDLFGVSPSSRFGTWLTR